MRSNQRALSSSVESTRSVSNWLWPAAIVLAGIFLRIWHISHGLPGFYEEAIPFRKSLAFWEVGAGLNPHFFNYPSLSIYLHFLIQKCVYFIGHLQGHYQNPAEFWFTQMNGPTTAVVVARLVGVLGDALTIWAVYRLGKYLHSSAGLVAAALVAFSPAMIMVSREIFVEPIWTALSMWTLERLVAYGREGRTRQLIAAIILCGLAVGTKYNAGLLLLPLAVALSFRDGRRAAWLFPLSALGSLVVFMMTSPYILIDFSKFFKAFRFESQHMAQGHLGTQGKVGASFLLETLGHNVGWIGMGVVLLAVAWKVIKRIKPSQTELIILAFLLPLAASVALFRMEAIRYVVPTIPPLSVLVGCSVASVSLWFTSNTNRERMLQAGLTLAIVGPIFWGGFSAGMSGQDSTQYQATAWLEKNLGPDDIIVQEFYGAPLPTQRSKQALSTNPHFPNIRTSWQENFLATREFRSLNLPLTVSGNMSVGITDADGRKHQVFMFDHAADFNQAFYHPALLVDVDYFLSSGSVRNRYENNPELFATQLDFYRFVESQGEVVKVFNPVGHTEGSALTIYQLSNISGYSPQGNPGQLSPLWWTNPIKREFRLKTEALLLPSHLQSQGELFVAEGVPAKWVEYVLPLFHESVVPFLAHLARHHLEVGHPQTARNLAEIILFSEPEHINACLTFSRSAIALGDSPSAEKILRRAIKVSTAQGLDSAGLSFELASLLKAQGRTQEALAELHIILNGLAEKSPYRGFVLRKIREWNTN